MNNSKHKWACWCLASFVLALIGCRLDMHDQPRYEPNSPSAFFPNGTSVRPLVEGVVARGAILGDPGLTTGKVDDQFVLTNPLPIDVPLLERGRERYDIHCAPCHGRVGIGDGMIVQRGYRQPPSLHEPRIRDATDGYLYDVIAQGYGVMPAYRAQIRLRDRWAIVAYLRALQLSQNARLSDVPQNERASLAESRGIR